MPGPAGWINTILGRPDASPGTITGQNHPILPFIGILRFFTRKSSERIGLKGISGASLGNKRLSENSIGFRLMALFLMLTVTFFLMAPLLGIIYEGLSLEFSDIPKEIYFRIIEAFKNSFLLAVTVSVVGVFVSWMTARGLCLCKARSLKFFDVLDGFLWVLMALSPAVLSMAWLHLTTNFDANLDGLLFFGIRNNLFL
jgi:ABC-type Fe3+ transport system permease subunit